MKTVIKDSGARTEFKTGAVRDVQSNKGRMDLLPKMALWALSRHYEEGAKKYEDRNWEKGMPISKMINSTERHLLKFELGMTDENHLIAAIWNALGMYETLLRIELGVLPKELNDLPYTFKDVDIDDNFDPWEIHAKFMNTKEKRMNKKLRIYLAGHVPEYAYRKYCIENYGDEFELLDPIAMVPEDQNYITIVEDDKKLIETSDILIAFIRKCTFGTSMEIPIACVHNIPVLVVNPDGEFKDDVWVKYHSEKIFRTLDECFSYIKETYVK